ncbi:MAG: hypothetical protein ACKOEX_12865 [Planctomycetia bacterium]
MMSRAVLRALVVGMAGMVVSGCGAPKKETPKKPPIQTRETLRKTTQNVLELEKALADGGVPASMEITGEGLEVYSDAYRTSVGRMGAMAVDQKMQLHEAEFGSKPKDYAEFMEKIIGKGQPEGIQLPMLPYYQEWAYDPEKKTLVVIEFPAKKEQRQKETTGAAGL